MIIIKIYGFHLDIGPPAMDVILWTKVCEFQESINLQK